MHKRFSWLETPFLCKFRHCAELYLRNEFYFCFAYRQKI